MRKLTSLFRASPILDNAYIIISFLFTFNTSIKDLFEVILSLEIDFFPKLKASVY